MTNYPHYILVTRPPPAGNVLCDKIKSAGYHALFFPTIEFLPSPDPTAVQQQLAALDHIDWLIFISPQAVAASQAQIHAAWPQLPSTLKIAAVGAGTADALRAANLPVTLYPEADWRSEGLLALPAMQTLAKQRVALVQGVGGREMLAETLAARGADLTIIHAYQRGLPQHDVSAVVRAFTAKTVDAVLCSSGDGLRHLTILLEKVLPQVQQTPLIVISERLRQIAETSGFQRIVVANNASHDAMMDALQTLVLSHNTKGQDMEPSTENETTTVVATPKHPSTWLNAGILCSTFAVIVLISAYGLGYHRLVETNQTLAALTTQLSTKIAANQADIASLQKTVTDSEQTIQTALTEQQRALHDTQTATTGNKDTLAVAEADYLTHLANDHLQIGDNIPLVITLLQTADAKLHDLSDANVTPLRKALATDIAALQAVPVVDRDGLYARLIALNQQIDQLPLPTNRPGATAITPAPTETTSSWWRRGLQQSWQALQKVVVIRYNKTGERPFIPPEQQLFLYQNLHAMFQQALIAVVQNQPGIYRASLTQAQAWIQHYFLLDAAATQAELHALTELQTVVLQPTLPTLSASLTAFREYGANANTSASQL